MLKPIFWIAICLLHTTLGALTTFNSSTPIGALNIMDRPSAFRLPTFIRPEFYKLEVITHLGDDDGYAFSGKVWIKVRLFIAWFIYLIKYG